MTMKQTKKITLNLPLDLINDAQKITKSGVTETIRTALEDLKKKESRNKLLKLKGKISIDIDLNKTRA